MSQVKAKAKVQPKVQAVDIENLAEVFIDLNSKLDKIMKKAAPIAQELDTLKKQIVAYANSTLENDETKEIAYVGQVLYIGKRGTSREVTDMERAIELMGVDTFLKVAKINLTDIDAYLRPDEVSEVTKTTRTDTRQVKVKNK